MDDAESTVDLEREDIERLLAEEFATDGVNAAVRFVHEHDLVPSIMLASIGSMFWTYLMMISPAASAGGNIDNALKYMATAAMEARKRVPDLAWAERMTHGETGHA
jgi:hypothetical protein